MAPSDISVRLRLLGAKRFETDATRGGKAVERIGAGGHRAGRGLRDADKHANRTNRSFRALARGAAGLGGAIGVYGLVRGVRSSLDAFRESQKVTRDTGAVIKSTGGAANVSATQVAELSRSLSFQAGVDDELIQKSQNVLLTFTKIRNEAGKNNKIFDEASQAVVDLSARFDKDLNTSAIMVGKALNDPIKGVTALGRAGVQFTQQEKDKIKTLVESGRQLEAQKLIMRTLKVQTAGAAKAQADPWDRLKVAVGNLQEDIGGLLAPQLAKAADKAGKFIDQFSRGVGPGGKFKQTLQGIWKAAKPIVTWFGRAALNVGKFAAKHPTVTKLAVAIGLAGVAINAIRSARAVKGIGTLLGALRRLVKVRAGQKVADEIAGGGGLGGLNRKSRGPLARFRTFLRSKLGSAGKSAGSEAGAAAAEETVSSTAQGMRGKQGRLNSFFGRLGRGVGLAFGVAAVLVINKKLSEALAPGNFSGGASSGAPAGDPLNAIKTPQEKLADKIEGFFGLQHGGSIRPGRTSVVGEVGPELVTARAGSAFVTPLPSRLTPKLQPIDAGGGLGEGSVIEFTHNTLLDGKVLERSVTRHAADAKARR